MEQELESMREAFGHTLEDLGAKMKDLTVVGADTTQSICSGYLGKKFPDRFFNVGIAEQNMIGISAGLALYGKTVFCGTYAVFLERAIDQIRNTIAYCNLDVKIVGSHTGISAGPDGGSHQAVEDIAIMRSLPNMKVIVPPDPYSTRLLVGEAAQSAGPFYIRLIRSTTLNIYEEGDVKVGRANVVRDGEDITAIACGIMVQEAIRAADRLRKAGISMRVIDCSTIKPLDTATILKAAKETGNIITAEDHSVIGGLGSAVAEFLSTRYPTKMSMGGVNDTFGESGQDTELMLKYGVSDESIMEKAKLMVRV